MSSLEQILKELRVSARRLMTISLWPPTDAAQTIVDVVATSLEIASAPPRPDASALEAAARGWRTMASALERCTDADQQLVRELGRPMVWQSVSADSCRRSLGRHAQRTDTLQAAARGIQQTLLANADVMSGARRRWEIGREGIARHVSISWSDLNPAVLADRLAHIVSDVVHGIHEMIASYEDALAVVESCRRAFDRIISDVRLPEHLPAGSGAVSGINGWSGTHVNQASVDAAIAAIGAVGSGSGVGMPGSHDDLVALKARLAELSPAEADAVIAGLTPAQLVAFGQALTASDLFGLDGMSSWDRLDVTSDLMSRLSPSSIDKLVAAIPWLQPSVDTTEVFLKGQQGQTNVPVSGLHMGMPSGSLWGSGQPGAVSFGDIKQGQFGDCWAISSLIVAARDNPQFLADGIRENPNGTVSVRLFDSSGGERWVTMTRDLPIDSTGAIVGARTASGALWPAYYEKALALTYTDDLGRLSTSSPFYTREQGTYGALETEFQWSAARYLTGTDSRIIISGDPREVEAAVNDGRQVLVGTRPVLGFETPPPGYVPNHVFYVHHIEGDTIVMGNPWEDSPERQVRISKIEFQRWFLAPSTLDTPHS